MRYRIDSKIQLLFAIALFGVALLIFGKTDVYGAENTDSLDENELSVFTQIPIYDSSTDKSDNATIIDVKADDSAVNDETSTEDDSVGQKNAEIKEKNSGDDFNSLDQQQLNQQQIETPSDGVVEKDGSMYFYKNGIVQKSGWIFDNHSWRYAGEDGQIYRNKWIWDGHAWYYAKDDGTIYLNTLFDVGESRYYAQGGGNIRQNGWAKYDGKWYYAKAGGQLYKSSWVYAGGAWYYAKNDCSIYQNCIFVVDGSKYYAEAGGNLRQNGWVKSENKWYFAGPGGGFVHDNWMLLGGAWYYAGSDCSIFQNCVFEVNGSKYYAQEGGNIRQNGWVKDNNKWYLAGPGGGFYRNRWVNVGGLWYYAQAECDIFQDGWLLLNNNWYYAKPGGDIYQNSWIHLDAWYYASPGGAIYQNTLAQINGYYYCFDQSGRMLSGDFWWNGQHIIAAQSGEISNLVRGIDVSVFQGWIDWAAVAQDNVKFAFIRAGGRFGVSGTIYDDSRFDENMRGATSNGISAGAYFFTQAVNEQEAVEEANYLISHVRPYNVSMPLVIDTEYLANGRHNNLTAQQRTNVIKAFCQTIANSGYTPMIYGSTSWLNNQLIMSQLAQYKVWVAQYYHRVTYGGSYTCWQNTSSAHVNGIQGNVDNDYWYNI